MAGKEFMQDIAQLQQAAELAKVAGAQQLIEKVRSFAGKYGESSAPTLQTELAKLQQLRQRQDGNIDQLRDLRPIANLLGMYDAADYIRQVVERADHAMQRTTN